MDGGLTRSGKEHWNRRYEAESWGGYRSGICAAEAIGVCGRQGTIDAGECFVHLQATDISLRTGALTLKHPGTAILRVWLPRVP